MFRAVRLATPCFAFVLVAATLNPASPPLPAAERSGAPRDDSSTFSHGDWPFRPPERPTVPQVRHQQWVANPIDAFILAELEKAGLRPSPRASRLALLRRVTFDLTGLPPTVQEQEAFLADQSDDAYEKVVDRLLASPRYGERWAQHWLDLVRYAETDGFNADGHRPLAHKYRDYVIKALNDDLPYDRFIAQQLAGDELEPDNPDAIVATGLNRLYPDEWNAADLRLRRQEILDDITDTTGLVFLGLTMGCAQCHDHKFDEILQADYFRLQAFFQPMLPCDDMPAASRPQLSRYHSELAAWEEATREIRARIDAIIEPRLQKIIDSRLEKYDPEIREAIITPPDKQTAFQKQIAFQARNYLLRESDIQGVIKALKGDEAQRYEQLQAELAAHDHLKPPPLPVAMAITDAGRQPPPTFVLATGNVRKPLGEVTPGFPEFLGPSEPQIVPPPDLPHATGRRSALVRWLTRSDHPLTARIMVNRIWQFHFGLGIVPSSNDFGAMGDPPSHPRLLDWLSVEFVDSGWSLKELHRLMVTSSTYCQTSLIDPQDEAAAAAQQKDPDNKLIWHARRRRLEGEAVRDAMLLVSGELNLRMYGPSARPDLPKDAGSQAWSPDKNPADQHRRSIYVLAKRNLRYPVFDAFDLPDLHHSCAQRSTTTTAPQALLLLNSELSVDRARHWAGRLLADHDHDLEALVAAACRQAWCRQASRDEVAAAVAFLAAQADAVAASTLKPQQLSLPVPLPESVPASRAAAVVDFCHALFNANEFLYVD